MGIKDIVFGKKSEEYAPSRITVVDEEKKKTSDLAQQTGRNVLGEMGNFYDNKNLANAVNYDTQRGLRSLTAQGTDLNRALQEKIAQRGMGTSSVGLNQELGIQRDISQRKGDLWSSQGQRLRDMQMQGFNSRLGAATKLAGISGDHSQMQVGQKGKRSGGLFKLAATGAGAYFGGPAGAAAGAGLSDAAMSM